MIANVIDDMLGGGGTDFPESIRGWGGDRSSVFGEELLGERVSRYSNADSWPAARHDVRNLRASLGEQGKRPWPAGCGEDLGGG